MKKINKKIEDALIKKALGYTLTETCEEFVKGEDDIVLNKKKITQKDVAPDIAALKLLIEYFNINEKEIENMSIQELMQEKEKLKQILETYDEVSNDENVKSKT